MQRIEHFFVVGAQRSGTTYLYHLLSEHPEIEMAEPLRPEPKFFHVDALYERGLRYYQAQFFGKKDSARRRGEKSTSYLESEKAAQRIAHHFPQAKILVLLRDPIDRAISHYRFSCANGLETLSIEDAFLSEEERWRDYDRSRVSVSPYAYLRRGRYVEYLCMYERYFPSLNIRAMLYEEFMSSKNLISSLYAFLGVTANYVPATLQRVANAATLPVPLLSDRLKKYLYTYFAEPNAELAKHLGRDLSRYWRI